MTLRVDEDLAKGGQATSTLADGIKVSRVFMVSGIEGNPSGIIPAALTAGRIPQVGEPHPSIGNITCDSVTAVPVDGAEVQVTANYSALKTGQTAVDENAQVQISFSSSVQSVETNQFFNASNNKELMILEYTFPPDEDPNGVAGPKKIVPTATREQAILVATLSRLESKPPLEKSKAFTEHLNKRTFLGSGPRTWLCTSITGVSSDGGQTYQVTYVFEFSQDKWDTTLAWRDEETGAIPDDVDTQPEALKAFQLQPTANFQDLDLEQFDG